MRKVALSMVTGSVATLLMTASAGTAVSAPAMSGPSASATTATHAIAAKATACGPADLETSMYQAADRPAGAGTGAAIVEFTNVSATSCIVRGFPAVAGAADGSSAENSPLTVTREGSASRVVLAPGGKAWTKLTFVQVFGEADGYCTSGSTPVTYPALVVGLPTGGSHEVAFADGSLVAECDDTVTVTAVSPSRPS